MVAWRLTSWDSGLWKERPLRETCAHGQPRVRDAPGGTPPCGPRPNAQHDLLDSLTRCHPALSPADDAAPDEACGSRLRTSQGPTPMSDQRYSAAAASRTESP